MGYFSAVVEGERRIKLLPIPPEPTPLIGLEITLLNFETDSVAGGLVGGNSATFQAMVNRAIKKNLRHRGARVNLATVKLDSILKWNDDSKVPSLVERLLDMAEVFNAVIMEYREKPVCGDDLHRRLQQLIKDEHARIIPENETPTVITALEESENARLKAEEQLVQAKAKPIRFAISQWQKKLSGQT